MVGRGVPFSSLVVFSGWSPGWGHLSKLAMGFPRFGGKGMRGHVFGEFSEALEESRYVNTTRLGFVDKVC